MIRKLFETSGLRSEFAGNLSSELIKTPEFSNYVSSGSPFGYIGHSARNSVIDDVLEYVASNADISVNDLALWMTSTYARHTMDSLADALYPSVKRIATSFFKEHIDEIKASIKSMRETEGN